MMEKCIITVGREFCTGGFDIAEKVAQKLGIKMYDKELITLAAKDSGLSEEAVAASEKQHTHSLLYSLYTMGGDLPLNDQVYIIQSHIVSQLAEKGPCVIVGRCADYILRDAADCLTVFIHADMEQRAKRIVEQYGERTETPEKRLRDKDKRRAAYYQYYTDLKWGEARNYHIALNSGALGIGRCVEIIAHLF